MKEIIFYLHIELISKDKYHSIFNIFFSIDSKLWNHKCAHHFVKGLSNYTKSERGGRGLRELNMFVLVIFISLLVTYSVKQSGGKVKYKSMWWPFACGDFEVPQVKYLGFYFGSFSFIFTDYESWMTLLLLFRFKKPTIELHVQ